MLRRQSLTPALAFLVACALALIGCQSQQQTVSDQQKSLTSLKATVAAVCEAWLAGSVSTTYARTTLEATAMLLEKQRTALAGVPDALADPTAAALSESENHLARSLALLHKALSDSDPAAVRQQLSAVSARQAQWP
jgi:hypothetical protein